LVLIGLAAIEQASLAEMRRSSDFAIALRIAIDELPRPIVLGRAVSFTRRHHRRLRRRRHPVRHGRIACAVPAAAVLKIVLAACYAEPAIGRAPQ